MEVSINKNDKIGYCFWRRNVLSLSLSLFVRIYLFDWKNICAWRVRDGFSIVTMLHIQNECAEFLRKLELESVVVIPAINVAFAAACKKQRSSGTVVVIENEVPLLRCATVLCRARGIRRTSVPRISVKSGRLFAWKQALSVVGFPEAGNARPLQIECMTAVIVALYSGVLPSLPFRLGELFVC